LVEYFPVTEGDPGSNPGYFGLMSYNKGGNTRKIFDLVITLFYWLNLSVIKSLQVKIKLTMIKLIQVVKDAVNNISVVIEAITKYLKSISA
jgi:hypothetical protein